MHPSSLGESSSSQPVASSNVSAAEQEDDELSEAVQLEVQADVDDSGGGGGGARGPLILNHIVVLAVSMQLIHWIVLGIVAINRKLQILHLVALTEVISN